MACFGRALLAPLALLLGGCIPSYHTVFINHSGQQLFFTDIPGKTFELPVAAKSAPIRVPFFGRGKENWLELQSIACRHAYAAPDLQKASQASFRRFSKKITLGVDEGFRLHLLAQSADGSMQEICEFGFPLPPTTRCESRP